MLIRQRADDFAELLGRVTSPSVAANILANLFFRSLSPLPLENSLESFHKLRYVFGQKETLALFSDLLIQRLQSSNEGEQEKLLRALVFSLRHFDESVLPEMKTSSMEFVDAPPTLSQLMSSHWMWFFGLIHSPYAELRIIAAEVLFTLPVPSSAVDASAALQRSVVYFFSLLRLWSHKEETELLQRLSIVRRIGNFLSSS